MKSQVARSSSRSRVRSSGPPAAEARARPMDDGIRDYLIGMEDRILRAFSNGAYAVHERIASLETATVTLCTEIKRLSDEGKDP